MTTVADYWEAMRPPDQVGSWWRGKGCNIPGRRICTRADRYDPLDGTMFCAIAQDDGLCPGNCDDPLDPDDPEDTRERAWLDWGAKKVEQRRRDEVHDAPIRKRRLNATISWENKGRHGYDKNAVGDPYEGLVSVGNHKWAREEAR